MHDSDAFASRYPGRCSPAPLPACKAITSTMSLRESNRRSSPASLQDVQWRRASFDSESESLQRLACAPRSGGLRGLRHLPLASRTSIMRPLLLLAAASLSLLAPCAQAQKAVPSIAEKVSWQSIACFGVPFICNKLPAKGYLFATPGATKVVMISHGSQGIDKRMYEYVDSLQSGGFAALVIDHWTPRGITVTHQDYAAAGRKGGNEFNMASDSLTAAEWLRNVRGYQTVGSIGESQGGGAAVMMQQKFAHTLIQQNVRRLYVNSFQLKP